MQDDKAYWLEKVSQAFGGYAALPETQEALANHLRAIAVALDGGDDTTLGLTLYGGKVVPELPPQSEVFAAVPDLALAMAFSECELNMGFRLAFNYGSRWEVETIVSAFDSEEQKARRHVEFSHESLPGVLGELNEFFKRESSDD